jgi:hypothetical protein
MRKIAASRQTNNKFNELTKDINSPNIPANKLNREIINRIETFLTNVNGKPLQNERLKFEYNFMGTYQRKFRKGNAREISFDTRNYRRVQYNELLERLFLELMSRANGMDSWYIKYHVKGENELQYQILSPLNKGKLEEYIDIYLNKESEVLEDSFFFFDAIPVDLESIKVIDYPKYRD